MSKKKRQKPEMDQINKIPVPKGVSPSSAAYPSVIPKQLGSGLNPLQANNLEESRQVLDAFQNFMARLGYGSTNLTEGTDYVNTRLTRNFMLLTTLYRSHWIIRKIIDVPVEDMCKNWYQFSSAITPDQIDGFQRVERQTKTKAAISKGLKWGRLYGGAAGVMMIKGHENRLDQPLDLDDVFPGTYCGIMVLDRWSGISPSAEYIEDINSPDFGLPMYYRVTTQQGQSFDVHSSRVLRFTGRELPTWEAQAEMMWGTSEVELLFEELKKRDNASFGTAALIFSANIRVLKMPELRQMLSSTNAAAQQRFYSVLQSINHLVSSQGLLLLDENDEFDTKQYSFTGISQVLENFMMDISGCAEIPCTKIFGRSPAGMNATGESDLQNYYDSIEQKQENILRPTMDKLIPVIAVSTWGYVPEDIDFTFNPPQTMPGEKLAELAGKKTESIDKIYNSGIIPRRTALQELRQMGDETGMWTNITDEMIASAETEVQQMGEMGGMDDGMMPGILGGSSPEAGSENPQASPKSSSPDVKETDTSLRPKLEILRDVKKILQNFLTRTLGGGKDVIQPSVQDGNREGRYKVGPYGGLPIHIENPIGSTRYGIGVDGKAWSTKFTTPYGYIQGVRGRDKDYLDCFLGPERNSDSVFVIDQINPMTGAFDEHKVMLGFTNADQALTCYNTHHGKDWYGASAVSKLSMDEFKNWIVSGSVEHPCKISRTPFDHTTDADFKESEHPRDEDGKFSRSGSASIRSTKIVNGERVKSDGSKLPSHITKLKIPPAWSNVQYSEDPKSDLLATGYDAKGRKQYIYNARFLESNAAAKFARIKELDSKFFEIEQEVEKDRKKKRLKEAADCLRLIMSTGIRPGSESDTKVAKKAFGATTLLGHHVVETEKGVSLEFTGKKGVDLSIPINDPDVASMLLERKKSAGADGRLFDVNEKRLLEYSGMMDGGGFKTKDFRTRLGTHIAMQAVHGMEKPTTEKEYKQAVKEVAIRVSKVLGNTPTVALQAYINPTVFAEWRI